MITDEIVEMIAEAEIINHTIVMIDGTIVVEEMIAGMIEIGETLGMFVKCVVRMVVDSNVTCRMRAKRPSERRTPV